MSSKGSKCRRPQITSAPNSTTSTLARSRRRCGASGAAGVVPLGAPPAQRPIVPPRTAEYTVVRPSAAGAPRAARGAVDAADDVASAVPRARVPRPALAPAHCAPDKADARRERRRGADMPCPLLAHPVPHLRRDRAHPAPHLRRDRARPRATSAPGQGSAMPTSAPGLGSAFAPRRAPTSAARRVATSAMQRGVAQVALAALRCIKSLMSSPVGLTPVVHHPQATRIFAFFIMRSVRRRGWAHPLRRGWAHPRHICVGTGSLPSASAAQVLANEIEAIRNVGKVALELCTAVSAFSPVAHQARAHTKHAAHPADRHGLVLGQMWANGRRPVLSGLKGATVFRAGSHADVAHTCTHSTHRRRRARSVPESLRAHGQQGALGHGHASSRIGILRRIGILCRMGCCACRCRSRHWRHSAALALSPGSRKCSSTCSRTASCRRVGSPLPTSAPGLGSPLPHLRRDRYRSV